MRTSLDHPLDLVNLDDDVELIAEELPDRLQLLSDCLSTASSLSTDGCWATLGCFGSIWSCG